MPVLVEEEDLVKGLVAHARAHGVHDEPGVGESALHITLSGLGCERLPDPNRHVGKAQLVVGPPLQGAPAQGGLSFQCFMDLGQLDNVTID